MKVLILSTPEDLHVHGVLRHLAEMNIETDCFRFNQFATDESRVCFSPTLENRTMTVKLSDGKVIDFQSYDSIWYRRAGNIQTKTFHAPWVRQMMLQESTHALLGMLNSLECLWVNHPAKDNQCLYKLYQLSLASRIGLRVPETIVTNDPGEVREFYEKCSGEVIYKLISEASNFSMPAYEMPIGIPTLPFRKADFAYLNQVKLGPHLFQRRVIKVYDVRTTIIGKEIFSLKIDSQAGDGNLDWRQDYSVEMTEYELPSDVSEACLNLMRMLGLNYGALDFCVSPDGEHYFLEVNCAGQYLWMEQRTELQISRALALLLAGKTEPLISAKTLAREPF